MSFLSRFIFLLTLGLLVTTQLLANEYKIGLRAHQGIEQGIKQWQPTVDYLNQKFPEHQFILKPIISLEELSNLAGQGHFDFIITNPSSYVDMEVTHGAIRLLTLVNKRHGRALKKFGSVAFALKDRTDISNYQDLKGKSVIAVSERAFGGWGMVYRELKKRDIGPFKDFASMQFAAGIQSNVVKAVLNKQADVGIIRTDLLERMAAKGKINLQDFRIISERKTPGFPFLHSTPLYPEWAFAYMPNVSDEIAQKVSIALLQLSPDSPAATAGNYMGWTIPLDYQPVHDLMKELKQGPYKHYGEVTLLSVLKAYWGWVVLGLLIIIAAIMTSIFVININRVLSDTQTELESAQHKLQKLLEERTQELKQSESHQQTILETVADGIITLDQTGIIQDSNPAIEKIFGYKSSELIGHHFNQLLVKPFITNNINTEVYSELKQHHELDGCRKNGDYFPLESSFSLISNNEESGIVGVLRDITDRKNTENDLHKSISALQRFHLIASVTNTSFEEKVQKVLALGNETFETNLAIISHISESDYEVKHIQGPDGAPPVGTHFEMENTYCFHTIRANAPIAFHAAGASEIKNHPCYQTFHLETYIGAPIIVDGKPYGTLNFSRAQKRNQAFTKNELSLVQLFAQWIGTQMEQEKIQKELISFKSTLDKTMDCVFMFDPDTLCFFYVNQGAMNQVGYHYDELMHMRAFDIQPEYDEDQFKEIITPLIKGQKASLNIETIHQHKDGHHVPVEFFLQYINPPDESPRFVAIVRDITERRRIDKMKNEFISTVSHELRTPLTSIRGSLGLITGGAVGEIPEAAAEMLQIASNNTQRLLLLINDILDIQKIESGEMTFKFTNVKTHELLTRAISDNVTYAQQHNVIFNLAHNAENLEVFGDPDRLTQVINNLLSNAAKFSPNNSSVEINAALVQGDIVRISVSDHGPGIPAAFQPKLFDKFTQADGSVTREKGGTGLGLSISKAIIEKHGGKIDFISKESEGTTFFIELPALKPALENPELFSIQEQHSSQSNCILIVEDDRDIAILLQRLLTHEGLNSDIAYNTSEARKLLKENKNQYKIITLDLMLPEEDGISFINRLRKDKNTRDIPVVIVSAKANETKHTLEAGAIGIADWINKPIDNDRLINVIRQATKNNSFPKVLHVEDEDDVHKVINLLLKDQCQMEWSTTLEGARKAIKENDYDLILLDIGLPDGSGLELLHTIKQLDNQPNVVIFSAQHVEPSFIDQVNAVLIKSQTTNQQLLATIKRFMA